MNGYKKTVEVVIKPDLNHTITTTQTETFASGSSWRNEVIITCPDWDHFPDLKKKVFKDMFPDAHELAFELSEGLIDLKIVKNEK